MKSKMAFLALCLYVGMCMGMESLEDDEFEELLVNTSEEDLYAQELRKRFNINERDGIVLLSALKEKRERMYGNLVRAIIKTYKRGDAVVSKDVEHLCQQLVTAQGMYADLLREQIKQNKEAADRAASISIAQARRYTRLYMAIAGMGMVSTLGLAIFNILQEIGVI